MKLIARLAALLLMALSVCPAADARTKADPQERPVTIVPNPKSLRQSPGTLKLDRKKLGISISDSSLRPAADILTGYLEPYGTVYTGDNAAIRLSLAEPDSLLAVKGAYRLDITPDGVDIVAAEYNGIINGITTLRQLLPIPDATTLKSRRPIELPCLAVADAPDYWWRGLHIDSSRHFWTIPEIEHIIDLMTLYKLSVMHWHLIDDQGWRVEIDRYPELTGKGAWRVFNYMDSACDRRAAQEPEMRVPRDRMRLTAEGDSVYGGYYTKAQLRHIVDYAASHGIEVVPEFDVPGHSTILTVVHPEIACGGRPNSSVCPGRDETLELCKNVYAELFEIFPSKYVHMGGDEVDKTRWRECDDCARRMADNELESAEELQAWFVRQMELFFRNNNRTLIGWDEITHDGLGSETAIMWWTAGTPEVVDQATKAGKRVTCTPTSCLYFDYPQPDIEVDKIIAFDPRAGLSPRQKKLVNGMQGNVWTEYIPTVTRIEKQIFPRMIALSESAWNADPATRLTTEEIWALIPHHLRRFDAMGVAYRQPDRLK